MEADAIEMFCDAERQEDGGQSSANRDDADLFLGGDSMDVDADGGGQGGAAGSSADPAHKRPWQSSRLPRQDECGLCTCQIQSTGERVLTWSPEDPATREMLRRTIPPPADAAAAALDAAAAGVSDCDARARSSVDEDRAIGDAHEAAFGVLSRFALRERGGCRPSAIQLRSWNEGVRTACAAISSMSSVQGARGGVTLSTVRLVRSTDARRAPGCGFHASARAARRCRGNFATHLLADVLVTHFTERPDGLTAVESRTMRDRVLCVVPVMLGSEQDGDAQAEAPDASAEAEGGDRPPSDECGGYFIVNGTEKIFTLQESMAREAFRVVRKASAGCSKKTMVAEFQTAGQQRNRWRGAYPITSHVRAVEREERLAGACVVRAAADAAAGRDPRGASGLCVFFGHSKVRSELPACVRVWDAMRALGIEGDAEMVALALVGVRGRARQARARAIVRRVEGTARPLSAATADEAAAAINDCVMSSNDCALDNIFFSHVSLSPGYRGLGAAELRRIKAWHLGMLASAYLNAVMQASGAARSGGDGSGGAECEEGDAEDGAPQPDERAATAPASGDGDAECDLDSASDDAGGPAAAAAAAADDATEWTEDAPQSYDEAICERASFITDRDHMKNKRVVGPGDAIVELLCACVRNHFTKQAKKICRTARSIGAIVEYVKAATSPGAGDLSCSSCTRAVLNSFRSGKLNRETENISYNNALTTLKNESALARLTHVRSYAPPRMSAGDPPTGSSTDRHSLHASQFGWVCPCNTPDDQSIGIRKNVAQTVLVSIRRQRMAPAYPRGEIARRAVDAIAAARGGTRWIRGSTAPADAADAATRARVRAEDARRGLPHCAVRVDDVHCCYACGDYIGTLEALCAAFPYDCEVAFPNGYPRPAREWIDDAARCEGALDGDACFPSHPRMVAAEPAIGPADDIDVEAESIVRKSDLSLTQFPVRFTAYSSPSVAERLASDIRVLPLCPRSSGDRRLQESSGARRAGDGRAPDPLGCTTVVVNGIIVGACETEDDAEDFVAELRRTKAEDLTTASIVHARETRSIVVCTSGCRFVRPLFVVHRVDERPLADAPPEHFLTIAGGCGGGEFSAPGEMTAVVNPLVLDAGAAAQAAGGEGGGGARGGRDEGDWPRSVADLVRAGEIEYVDPAEEDRALVCRTLREFVDGARRGVAYTHCEVSPMAMFSIAANSIPFPECNQMPRNVFFCHMGPQAMGVAWRDYLLRCAKTQNLAVDVQRPLSFCKGQVISEIDDLPAGQNVMVALLPYGDDIEDNNIANADAIDRGFGMAYIVKTVVTQCDASAGLLFRPAAATGGGSGARDRPRDRSSSSAASAAADGGEADAGARLRRERARCVVGLGSWVRPGDIVAYIGDAASRADAPPGSARRGTITEVKAPCEGLFEHAAFVDDDATGTTLLEQQYVSPYPLDLGDKLSPRDGQKSTTGLRLRTCDMPWDARTGATPTVIMNPHAFAARMTWAQAYEMALGSIAAQLGMRFDASAFEYAVKVGSARERAARARAVSAAFSPSGEPNPALEPALERCEERWNAVRDSCAATPPQVAARSRLEIVSDALQALGLPKTEKRLMYSAATGRPFEALICMGITYVQRLKQCSYTKVLARSRGAIERVTLQPIHGGLRCGEMERNVIISHAAARLLAERFSTDVKRFPACSACGALSIVATGDDPAATSVCAICGRSDTHVSIELPMSTVNLLHLLSCIGVGTRLGLTGTGDASFEKIE